MLNHELKEKAIERLQTAEQNHADWVETVTHDAQKLFDLRTSTARRIIRVCESYINTLANSPKEFDKSVAAFKLEYDRFRKLSYEIEVEAKEQAKIRNATVGAGVAAGVGVAAFAPSAAIAIATTFGTASTGAAISTLSGAAATNATLAWLGGGALAAGGSGMVGGQALLAMAGPVGWTIGSVAVTVGMIGASSQNEKVAKETLRHAARVKAETAKLKAADMKVTQLHELTSAHAAGVCAQLGELSGSAPGNYLQFSREQKQTLAALINNMRSLSKLLKKKIA